MTTILIQEAVVLVAIIIGTIAFSIAVIGNSTEVLLGTAVYLLAILILFASDIIFDRPFIWADVVMSLLIAISVCILLTWEVQ